MPAGNPTGNDYHSMINFQSHAPGYWQPEAMENWHDHKWQLKNRINSLSELEKHINLSQEERTGIILSGNRLAMSITPHFMNLVDKDDPNCPIRRQIIPRMEDTAIQTESSS